MSVKKIVEVYTCDLCGENMKEGLTLKQETYKTVTNALEESINGAHICCVCAKKIGRYMYNK